MATFRTRLLSISKERGKIILANDYDDAVRNLESRTIKNIKKLHPFLCGIKLNFHLLLPLGTREITRINQISHQFGLQTIADIKLNDIGNTNQITAEHLWNLGFDAVIVNPIMGLSGLKNLVRLAHRKNKGIISLCHMSSPEAQLSYEIDLKMRTKYKLYQLFLDWATIAKVDGIVVGATFPEIIKYCHRKAGQSISIFSPGIGTQGGNANKVISAGSDFLIVGRTILNSKDPISIAKQLQQECFKN